MQNKLLRLSTLKNRKNIEFNIQISLDTLILPLKKLKYKKYD